jgi:small GTP-binding protein
MQQDAMFKVIVFGDGGVGKTTLLNRYLTGLFDTGTSMTIGVDFKVKKIQRDGIRVSMQIWDFAGEDRFRFLLPHYVLGSSGGIFMYDITRYTSLKKMDEWLEIFTSKFEGRTDPLPIIMVGSKLDLEYKRTVSKEQARQIAEEKNLYGYMECSSKTGENVEEIFQNLSKLMLERCDML